jgi:hypothetical protein
MQINLKQVEIQAALKQYITTQGINLAGKEVEITFTAGRKEGGLTADISIEDSAIPFGDDDTAAPAVASAPALTVVATAAPEAAPQAEEAPAAAESKVEEAAAEVQPKAVASLFN